MAKRRSKTGRVLLLLLLLLAAVIGGFAMLRERGQAMRFFGKIQVGWNLGNTLDVHNLHFETDDPADFETYWGNPVTTRKMLKAVRDAGFDAVRIPVTWYPHMDGQYRVDAAWLDRVDTVMRYALDCGLYVILNAHHDAWYTPSAENGQAARVMEALWTQICDRFADCGERLIFESMNEPRLIGTEHEWTAGTPEARDMVNNLNQVFVDTVRASTAKNNAKRYLLVPTYCARTEEEALRGFEVPDDPRVGVSVHLYLPYSFAHDEHGPSEWRDGDPENGRVLEETFENLNRYFTEKRTPVVITEFGAIDKNNESDRAAWASRVMKLAKQQKIPCVWWDAGGRADKEELSFSIFDRRNLRWRFPNILSTLTGDA